MELTSARALVTGAGHRIGRAIALGLAAEGSDLVIHYHTSSDEAEETADAARRHGGDVQLVRCDLAEDGAEVLRMASEHGPVSILVNSAGVFPDDRLSDVTPDGFDWTLAVNLKAPVFLTQAFAAALPADTRGAVVNVGDWRARRPYTDHFSYSVSKGALEAFTIAAAESLAPGIRVNAVALGAMLPPPGKDAGYLKELAGEIPLQRVGGVEPAVEAVLHLLRNEFVTGEIVRVDGGAHLV